MSLQGAMGPSPGNRARCMGKAPWAGWVEVLVPKMGTRRCGWGGQLSSGSGALPPHTPFLLPGRSGCSSTRPFWESHELCTEATGLGRPIINEL